jgi:hypothetical protein
LYNKLITKSSLDTRTEHSSGDDSDSEIEYDIEHPTDDEIDKHYNEPEYNVDEDGYQGS